MNNQQKGLYIYIYDIYYGIYNIIIIILLISIYYIYITNYTTLYNQDKMWWNKRTWGLKHQKGWYNGIGDVNGETWMNRNDLTSWCPWNDGNWIAGIIPKWAYDNSYFFQASLFSLTINKGGNHPCFSICGPFMAWFWFWPLWRDGYGWCFLEINLAIRSKPI